MKGILVLLMFWGPVVRAVNERIITTIKSLDKDKRELRVMFWDDARVYRLAKDHPLEPCLRNAWMAKMNVDLKKDADTGQILECRLYSGPPPGMEAQEADAR